MSGWKLLLSGTAGAALLSGYIWLGSFNADVTNVAIYEMAEVIAIPFGFWFGVMAYIAFKAIAAVVHWFRTAMW